MPSTERKMTSYLVEFERIGRNHDVPPLTATATDAEQLANEIYKYARPHLASRGVLDVSVDLDTGRGLILCGFRDGGRFTVTAQDGGQ